MEMISLGKLGNLRIAPWFRVEMQANGQVRFEQPINGITAMPDFGGAIKEQFTLVLDGSAAARIVPAIVGLWRGSVALRGEFRACRLAKHGGACAGSRGGRLTDHGNVGAEMPKFRRE